jgi:hypothetical protein
MRGGVAVTVTAASLTACIPGGSSDGSGASPDEKPTIARCQAILSMGNETYWGIQIGTDRIHLTAPLGRGDLSSCREGTSAQHSTGMFTTVYRLDGFGADTAVVSRGGPGDPFTLWVKTTGDEPPFVVPARLQRTI